MVNPDDRRRFFKELLAEAAENAKQAHVTLGPLSPLNKLERLASIGLPDPPREDRPAWMDRATVRARPAQRTASIEELQALAAAEGLEDHLEAIGALARHSVRLTHREVGAFGRPGRSRLGGEPDLPEGTPWPIWQGLQLEFLGQVDLADVHFPGSEAVLPSQGLLLLFFDADGTATGLDPEHLGSAQALLVDAPPRDDEEDDGSLAVHLGSPVDLSVELVLPRVKSAAVRALGLSAAERKGWRDLRLSLARAQGVGPDGDATALPAVHRLLGYADETAGDMPAICELVRDGHNLEDGDEDGPTDEKRAAVDPSRWRLLAQFSVDDELDPCWADFEDRLYLWVDEGELRDGTLSTVIGIPR